MNFRAPATKMEALHDMGSPLSAMRVLLELLRLTGGKAESRVELIAMLDNQVTELAERVEALLKQLGPGEAN